MYNTYRHISSVTKAINGCFDGKGNTSRLRGGSAGMITTFVDVNLPGINCVATYWETVVLRACLVLFISGASCLGLSARICSVMIAAEFMRNRTECYECRRLLSSIDDCLPKVVHFTHKLNGICFRSRLRGRSSIG